MLTAGPPPPPDPPLESLEPSPVATDPRKRIFAREEEGAGGIVRLVWDADDPLFLEAELRRPEYGGRPTGEAVRSFWDEVKVRTRSLGALAIDGADPIP